MSVGDIDFEKLCERFTEGWLTTNDYEKTVEAHYDFKNQQSVFVSSMDVFHFN